MVCQFEVFLLIWYLNYYTFFSFEFCFEASRKSKFDNDWNFLALGKSNLHHIDDNSSRNNACFDQSLFIMVCQCDVCLLIWYFEMICLICIYWRSLMFDSNWPRLLFLKNRNYSNIEFHSWETVYWTIKCINYMYTFFSFNFEFCFEANRKSKL